ncbi:MAG: dihydropteroate synthase [Marinilabiliaceae bacterium]|nr:dihydropteroate synthase [Marinilabiliaceae bacterium]
MGILNITPDSFFDGGKYQHRDAILKRCDQILDEGGDMIDIGAYSSRPGAVHVAEQEEGSRLIEVLSWIREIYPRVILSVDTFRASVAEKCVREFSVDIINDISGGVMDKLMFETISRLKVPYIMMHMKGIPQNMQMNPVYENLIKEISLFFSNQLDRLTALGVSDVILDPGFGFGKTIDHNYQLMNGMEQFDLFKLPVLVGVSRKSMIYKLLDIESAAALNGTTVLNTIALTKGANILRVHDVKEAVECVKLVSQLQKTE